MRNDTENSFEQSHRLSQQHAADAVSPYELTEIEDRVYSVRFKSSRRSHLDAERIDLVKAGNPFFQRILDRYATPIQSKGQRVHVPTVEAAIALKFAAAISPNRGDESRPQDRIDLLAIVRKHTNLNQAVLAELGDLVYSGGGVELQTFVRDVQAGKNVVI